MNALEIYSIPELANSNPDFSEERTLATLDCAYGFMLAMGFDEVISSNRV
nr:hypothetical protein [Streptococcus infantis]